MFNSYGKSRTFSNVDRFSYLIPTTIQIIKQIISRPPTLATGAMTSTERKNNDIQGNH